MTTIEKPTSKYQTPAELGEQLVSKMLEQERMYVQAGFPADGVTDLMRRWWDGWNSMSPEDLRETISDDLVYADPTTGNQPMLVGQPEADLWVTLLKTVHANLYYQPMEDAERTLPYWDFSGGNVRIALAYRIVGHFRPFRPIDVELVDRYDLVRDPERGWLISRIDTNGDFAWPMLAALPIPIKPPSQKTIRAIQSALYKVFPSLQGPELRPFVERTIG